MNYSLADQVELLRSLESKHSNQPDYWLRRGMLSRRTGDLDSAIKAYSAAISLAPDWVDPRFNRANAHQAAGNLDEAISDYKYAIHLNPKSIPPFFNLGLLYLHNRNDPLNALACFEEVIRWDSGHGEALLSAANALLAQGKWLRALSYLDRAIALKPADYRLWVNKALVLSYAKSWAQVLDALSRAMEIFPDCPEAYLAAGNAHKALDDLDRALHCYDHALRLRPDYPEALFNRASVSLLMRRLGEAKSDLTHALKQRPCWPDAEWQLGMISLLEGNYAVGWRLCEKRFGTALAPDLRPTIEGPLPSLAMDSSKVLWIFAEQGLGDCIQFSRFIPKVAEDAPRIGLICPKVLHPLLISVHPDLELSDKRRLGSGDGLLVGLMSLPFFLGLARADLWSHRPYLTPPASQVDQWRFRLGPRKIPRVGLAWSGHPGRDLDQLQHTRRRISLGELLPLLDFNAEFHALQKDLSPEDGLLLAKLPIHWHGDQLFDFGDTSALISQMDWVITIDTSVAHVAGALGADVWVLLAFSTDYRWGLSGCSTPWYPSARLYRQREPGIWDDVISRVYADMASRLS